jgi:3',5'-cyclic-AMP phosphodiesterase
MKQTIAYITDIHLDETYVTQIGVDPRANWQRILDDVQARGIRSIIFGGDIGEPSAHAWFFESLKGFNLQLTLGNHDTFAEVSKHFKRGEWQEEAYYAYEDNEFKYLFLDTSANTISATQKKWLEGELTTPKHLLLFIHHPILAVDTPVDRAYPLQGREELQQHLLQRNAPTIIFCGHYHMLDEQTKGGIRQYITPAASYQIIKEATDIETNNSRFGYRIITLTGESVSTELITFESH